MSAYMHLFFISAYAFKLHVVLDRPLNKSLLYISSLDDRPLNKSSLYLRWTTDSLNKSSLYLHCMTDY